MFIDTPVVCAIGLKLRYWIFFPIQVDPFNLESQNQAKLGNNISATGRYNFSFLIVKGSKSHPLRATLYDIHSQYE